ncbi:MULTISPECIES: nitrite/sulfite reductase domain-containing protein [Desulfobacula]|uniref:Nitrite and sulfite reductase 4Fe-4S region protein n=2 Tax=Desulfobacula TaxID=28222 RepID=K0NIU7_DESTT|nr:MULTISPECIES: NAD(P)/FAD-dependent oxidoreductase [Desulfobacula]CCK78907.1 nitrite and sulfite reductase 4Fe-4S region protein [Desulfobacula toluolica Tol2]SDU09665.1 Nitrite/Sulfite reductase ferredoxin-like half domain-containing protein [Desulfobacula phenolica]
MLKDGEKGVIRQRGKEKETYAIAPHLPCGIVNPDQLRKLADVAQKYNVSDVKITSAARIALIGITEDQVDGIWKDLGMDAGHATGLCVRSIKVCPGTAYCRLAQQDSLKMGMALDETYHGMVLPSKMKMGVSGCKIQCAENCIKDISLYGTKNGWTVMVGGNGSARPRLADLLVEDLDFEDARAMVAKVVAYYKENSKRERMGRMIERIGLDIMKAKLNIK